MTNEFRFVSLGEKAGWLLMIAILILSAIPASFLYAVSATGASIENVSPVKSSYNTNEEVVLKVVRGNSLPQAVTVGVALTSANGGEFRKGTLAGSCSDTWSLNSGTANISSDDNQKAFCYRNVNSGSDTITAIFTVGSSTETAILRLEIVPTEVLPDQEPEVYVNICQATEDSSAPFLPQTVAAALILSNDSSISDSDIIPAFGDFPGQNWDSIGQAIFANECDPIVIDPEPVVFCKVTIVSDDTNTVVEKANAYAKLVSSLHSRWTAVVNAPSAWIWGDDPTADPVAETNYTFEKKFGWNGPVTNATLTIAADNGYVSKINDVAAGADSTEYNYLNTGVDVHDVTTLINQGNNVLAVAVKNWAMANGTTATNPGGLKYELVVTGTDKNCDIPYEEEPEEPTTATVSICKLDADGNKLPNWNLMLLGKKIEDLVVPANTATGVDTTNVLASSKNYVALATGTWNNNRGLLNIVDAEYSTEDNWLTQMDGFTGLGTAILELSINDAVDPNSNWGYYNSLHRYAQSFTGATGTLNLSVKDSFYGDNTGNLNVALYEGYAGMTGENGCVNFTEVPVGDYVIDEIQKDGWENVSGLNKITVSNELARQIVVNRPTPVINPEEPVATIIAHKIVCTDEAELPNWGMGGPNMTATTASDWVSTHKSCSLTSGWEFEWAPSSAGNPDTGLPTTAFYGVAGGVWTKFGPTNASGTAKAYLDATDLGSMSHVWMREVLKDNYLPFTFGPTNATNTNAVSAELYCHTDVANYDNYERVDGIKVDSTYHCVAWNHKVVEEPEEPVLTCESEVELITNGSFENEKVTDSALWERFATVLGWNIVKVSNSASTTLELHRGWSGNLAAVGAQYAELDGDHSTMISQMIPTIVGETYTLGWDFAPRQLTAAEQNQLAVLIDNSLVLQTGPTASVGTLAVADWVPGTYSFVATASSTKIAFKNEGPSDSFGTFIDDVSLRCTGTDDEDDDGEDGGDDEDEDDNATTTPPVVEPEDEDEGGSNTTGTRVGYRGGRVAGASTTTVPFGTGGDYPQIGAVLGDQISAMPYGAPNAGQGGATSSTLPFWSLALGLCFLALVRQFRLG